MVLMSSGVDPAALRSARERLGLTQQQLARLIGVAGGERISRWELGLDEPRPGSLARLARVLHAPVVDLLDVEPQCRDLRALRYCAGLSAAEAAAAAHISLRSYQRWEFGSWVRPPSAASLRAMARALAVPLDTICAALDLSKKPDNLSRSPVHSPEA